MVSNPHRPRKFLILEAGRKLDALQPCGTLFHVNPHMAKEPWMIRLMAVLSLVVATGCAKKVKTSYHDEPADPNGQDKLKQNDAAFQKLLADCTLHFGFDDASLTEADRTMLEKVAMGLRARPALTLRIAGHADER